MSNVKRHFGVYWVGTLTKGWVLGESENELPKRFYEDEAKKYAERYNRTATNGTYIVQRIDDE